MRKKQYCPISYLLQLREDDGPLYRATVHNHVATSHTPGGSTRRRPVRVGEYAAGVGAPPATQPTVR